SGDQTLVAEIICLLRRGIDRSSDRRGAAQQVILQVAHVNSWVAETKKPAGRMPGGLGQMIAAARDGSRLWWRDLSHRGRFKTATPPNVFSAASCVPILTPRAPPACGR